MNDETMIHHTESNIGQLFSSTVAPMPEVQPATKSVYVVTQGEYSDYHIIAVFDNEVQAKLCADRIKVGALYSDSEVDVETYSVNPVLPEQWHQGLTGWRVEICCNGKVRNAFGCGRMEFTEETRLSMEYDLLMVSCWAKDKKHAIKIANEKRTMLIVQGQWPMGDNHGSVTS